MKEGKLFYNFDIERYDIIFDSGEYYGGLHCGDCFEIFIYGSWRRISIEYDSVNKEWYIPGEGISLDDSHVRI